MKIKLNIIWKLILLFRTFLLLILTLFLINNKYYIEGSIIALYILSEIILSRISEIERRLNKLKKLEEEMEKD